MLDEEEERRLKKERRLAAAETSLDVFVVGASHHNAKVEVREKLAIPQDEWSESAQAIVDDSNGAIAEAAELSIVIDSEVYVVRRATLGPPSAPSRSTSRSARGCP